MACDLNIVVHPGHVQVKLVDQGHRSKFTVTGGKCSFSTESESETGKTCSVNVEEKP